VTLNVSAIICTRNRPDLIGSAALSVLDNTYPDFDLLVVDQSDDDRTGTLIRELMIDHPNLRYIHSSTPGLSRAYNTGIRESTGSLLVFTDDDCVAYADWIAATVAAFEADPEADMQYGQVLRAPSLVGVEGEVPELKFNNAERFSRSDGFRVCGMGANFAARRRIFERVGGFDEALGGGGPLKSSQDYDFQYRVFRAGAVVALNPASKVDHYGLRNYAEQWPATLRAYGFGDGAFYAKHIRCGDTLALRLLVTQVGRMLVRVALTQLGMRHGPSPVEYLRSCFVGMWRSLEYPIDHRQRLYGDPACA
jgi:glycosyltransferase involved in cell wall biosynthesis